MTNLDIQSCTMMTMMMMMMMMIWTVSPAVVHHSHHKYDPKVALKEINKRACDLKNLNLGGMVPYKHRSNGICKDLYCLAEKALNNTTSGQLGNLTTLLHHFNKNVTCRNETNVISTITVLLEDICNCSGHSNV